MTTEQFEKMLNALKIPITESEFLILTNRFEAYSSMVDKNRFFDELNWVKVHDPMSFVSIVSNKNLNH